MIDISQKGFTLIECIISLAMFLIIFTCAGKLVFSSVRWHSSVVLKQEVFENVRISIDFMVNQIRQAQQIQLSTQDGTLKKLKVYPGTSSTPYDYFSFNENKLMYGGNNGDGEKGNELASSIDDVKISLSDDKKIMKIKVIGKQDDKNEVSVMRILNLKYKTVN